jgi:hypothetical protein
MWFFLLLLKGGSLPDLLQVEQLVQALPVVLLAQSRLKGCLQRNQSMRRPAVP